MANMPILKQDFAGNNKAKKNRWPKTNGFKE